jgi:hypothetical protein
MLYVDPSDVWAALRLDLVPDGGSPEGLAPADAGYVETLILAAQERMDKFLAVKLADRDEVPTVLKIALMTDVSTFYFNRMNPQLPDVYFEMIAPFRRWGFGGATEEEE